MLRHELTDDTLIQAIASGQGWAMEALYQRYSALLYTCAYRIVADHQIAEDIRQESFLAAWRHVTSYSPKLGAISTWLVSIAYHRAIDYVRTVHRQATLKSMPLEEVRTTSHAASSDVWNEVWQSIQGTQVREALTMLPLEQRPVIELAYFQGWTHAEIAGGCQIPLGTVKGRMRLGLLRMKRILEQMGMSNH